LGVSQPSSESQSIVEALGDMVWVRDMRTHELLYVSSNAQAFLGLRPDVPYTSASFFDAVHPDDRARVLEALRSGPDTYAIDFRFYKNGALRYGRSRARFVYDAAGERVRVEGSTSDVTESRQREVTLQAAIERAETLTRVAGKLSMLLGLDEAMKMVCEETARALSTPSVTVALYDPATGDVVARYGHGTSSAIDFPVAPYAMVVQMAPHGAQQIADMRARPDLLYADQARDKNVRSIAFAGFVRGGEVYGYLNVISYGEVRELTPDELTMLKGIADVAVGALANARLFAEKERVEARLRESEKRYRGIVETTQEGIALVDADGVFHYCNARFAEIFDVSREEVIGKPFVELLFDDVDVAAMRAKFETRLSGTMSRVENRVTTRKGRQVWYSSTTARAGAEGRQLLVVVSDVTEARRLSEKLQSAQKAESLGLLAGGVAHDFNNLLVSVLGNAGFALMELPPESPVRPVVLDIQTAAQRASELTRQLLAYSGRGRFVIARLDLGRVVEEMAHLLSAVISKKVVLHYALAKHLPAIEGDPTQIRQIVMNLITNASDAIGDQSGVISVTTSVVDADRATLADAFLDDELPPGPYVRLTVTDTGVGMTPETRAKIFDPFFSTKFTGRGLGLAAALGILRAHRGAIKVESAVGRGATFEVLFPAVEGAPLAGGATTASPRPPRAGTTILVVDDDASVRAVVKRILAQHGHTVLEAADGAEALAAYGENRGRIAAVILDLTMPNMSGEETFRRLRELDPQVRVLLASGYTEQEATSRFAGKGLAGFLAKPFTPDELEGCLAAVLAGGRDGVTP
jgi:PAS domain S-box-containing protein